MLVKNQKDFAAGLFFVLVAIVGLWVSRDYPIGLPNAMEKGYVPRLLLWVLLGLGAVITGRSFLSSVVEQFGPFVWRPVVMVTLAFVAFGLTVERLGMVVATLLLVGFGGYAGRGAKIKELLVVGALLAAASAIIFVKLVGLPIPIWPRW